MAVEPFFLSVGHGRRLCLYHRPPGAARGAILYVHPFAEEMNKSRRMAALQARAFAAAGYAVLQIDLLGCGESSGDFADATWDDWIADVVSATRWLHGRSEGVPLWFWSLRAGSLIATAAAARIGGEIGHLLWQPVVSGKQFMRQFRRCRLAGEMLSGDTSGAAGNARVGLADDDGTEIGGYCLRSALAVGLESAELELPPGTGRVEWLELAAVSDASQSPATLRCIERWQATGRRVRCTVVAGAAFWQTTEITECRGLIDATLDVVMDEA